MDEKEVRVFDSAGAPLLTIMRAPVKSRARMLNKLQSAKVRPKPEAEAEAEAEAEPEPEP